MNVQRGMRDSLLKYVRADRELEIIMEAVGQAAEYEYCCFAADENNRLSDERYLISRRRTSSPEQAVQYVPGNGGAVFKVTLNRLPPEVHKLVFAVHLNGSGVMRNVQFYTLAVRQNGETAFQLRLTGSDFQNETAVVGMEFYQRNGEWRFSLIARGFNGGMEELFKSYGAEMYHSVNEQSGSGKQNEQSGNGKPSGAERPPDNIPKSGAEPSSKPVSLKKGEKVSLVKSGKYVTVENGWAAPQKDYDLKALVRYRDGRLIYVGAANDDEVLQTPEGAVRHGGDVQRPGESEKIIIKWDPSIASVAVSSYSARENGTGSFYRYGVFVRITSGAQVIEIPATGTNTNDRSYTLCFGEILFGKNRDELTVSALELYSKPNSEHRIGYRGDRVVMDIGPVGRFKK